MITEIINGFKLIGQAFIKEPGIWWFLIPVFLLWLGMEIYFGQYKKDRLGWNSILANGISFAWINIAAFRVLFMNDIDVNDFWARFIILFIFAFYSLFVIYIGFFHKLSQKTGSFLAGPTQIYFLSVVSILWGQGLLVINKFVFLCLLIAYIVLAIFFWIIRRKLGILGEVEAIEKGEKPE
ncbi:MAG: hypothetical protein ABIJ17_02250 [Patescibacteria group bacterium]